MIWLAKLFLKNLRRLYRSYLFYRKFHVFLPEGGQAPRIKNISIGKNFSFGPRCELYCQNEVGSLQIGDHVSLNSGVMLNADGGGHIQIGNYVLLGPNVVIRAANHRFDDVSKPIRAQGHKAGTIILEDDVWLGAGVIVLPDVRIGKGAIIGAGSVVAKDIPPYSVAVGVPAKPVKQRPQGPRELVQ